MSMSTSDSSEHHQGSADPDGDLLQPSAEVTSALSRRGFLGKGGLAAMASALGAKIVFSDKLPSGLIPVVKTNGVASAL